MWRSLDIWEVNYRIAFRKGKKSDTFSWFRVFPLSMSVKKCKSDSMSYCNLTFTFIWAQNFIFYTKGITQIEGV